MNQLRGFAPDTCSGSDKRKLARIQEGQLLTAISVYCNERVLTKILSLAVSLGNREMIRAGSEEVYTLVDQ